MEDCTIHLWFLTHITPVVIIFRQTLVPLASLVLAIRIEDPFSKEEGFVTRLHNCPSSCATQDLHLASPWALVSLSINDNQSPKSLISHDGNSATRDSISVNFKCLIQFLCL